VTIGVLQETTATGQSGASMSKAFTSNVTLGSSIHVWLRALTATSFPSVTDTLGNTYTQRGATQNDGSSHIFAQFTCDNSAAGANTVTANMSPNGSSANITIREIGGTSGYDVQASQLQVGLSNSTTTDSITSGNATPSVFPGMVSALSQEVTGPSNAPVAGSGFTSDGQPWGTNSVTEHLRYTSLAARAATWTGSNTGGTTFTNMAAFFKEIGAGVGGGQQGMLTGVGS
jgi:hypothetical protein